MPARQTLGLVIAKILDLVYPPRCLGCSAFGHWLCPGCLSRSTFLSEPHYISERDCATLRTIPVWSVGVHQGILRQAVHALKYDGLRALAQPMGRLMAAIWREHRLQADYIVPVPLHSQRMKERGYNQSWLLANVLAAEVGVTATERALARMRDTPAQVSLSAQERRANVSGAFVANNEVLSNRRVVLLDDVCTSGATLLACAAAIEAVNGNAVAAITFTRALRLEPDL